jgi:hypothetical protein
LFATAGGYRAATLALGYVCALHLLGLTACLLACVVFLHTTAGGYRAATLALGYVRALHLLGLNSQARYLASNSGGSWFNAAYSYQQVMPAVHCACVHAVC